MTDATRLPDPLPAVAALPRGAAVILRHYESPDREALARKLAHLCRRRGVRLLIAGDTRLAIRVGADGVHLPEHVLAHGSRVWALWRRQRRPRGWLVTAAAHSSAALHRAARAGIDAVLLSPVFATPSHPGARTIGPLRFTAMTGTSPLPVYALGGINTKTARRLIASGLAGIAAIGGLQTKARQMRRPPLPGSPRRKRASR
ncbi:MAG: thiamine phosphate synthase [Rhodospirillales bacterium]|nr:thiamine phosphate synthase [Rhodospirillales bacterium]